MATLNQLSLPDELHAAIKRRAAEQGITIEEQVLRDLAVAEGMAMPVDANGLDEIRRDRQAMASKGVHLTDDFLRDAKAWGRE
jgi:plasmid stability protein